MLDRDMSDQERPPAGGTPRPARPGAALRESLSVVIVDDDPRWREVAAEPFLKRGDRVRQTSDGLQALQMCIEDPPDVVLSDVQMPRVDGWQLLRLIRARPQLEATPVIFMTSLDSDSARLKGYQLGVDAYVPKPFAGEELLIRVHRMLRTKRAPLSQRPEQIVLRGELEHVSVGSLLSFLSVEKRTGILVVVGENVARLFIKDGRLLRVELQGAGQPLASRAAALEVLDWSSGQFELIEEPVQVTDEIRVDVSTLLLEHAHMVDERRR